MSNIYTLIYSIIVYGGDPVSTWVAKPEGHVEDVANLVKNVTKTYSCQQKRNS